MNFKDKPSTDEQFEIRGTFITTKGRSILLGTVINPDVTPKEKAPMAMVFTQSSYSSTPFRVLTLSYDFGPISQYEACAQPDDSREDRLVFVRTAPTDSDSTLAVLDFIDAEQYTHYDANKNKPRKIYAKNSVALSGVNDEYMVLAFDCKSINCQLALRTRRTDRNDCSVLIFPITLGAELDWVQTVQN